MKKLILFELRKVFSKRLSLIVLVGILLFSVLISFSTYQNKYAFDGVSAEDAKKIVIAYEPVWAIGTGRTATADEADAGNGVIRKTLADLYDAETAEAVTIQYGGSMNAKNAAELLSKVNVDGGLIGGASLKSADFGIIVAAAK